MTEGTKTRNRGREALPESTVKIQKMTNTPKKNNKSVDDAEDQVVTGQDGQHYHQSESGPASLPQHEEEYPQLKSPLALHPRQTEDENTLSQSKPQPGSPSQCTDNKDVYSQPKSQPVSPLPTQRADDEDLRPQSESQPVSPLLPGQTDDDNPCPQSELQPPSPCNTPQRADHQEPPQTIFQPDSPSQHVDEDTHPQSKLQRVLPLHPQRADNKDLPPHSKSHSKSQPSPSQHANNDDFCPCSKSQPASPPRATDNQNAQSPFPPVHHSIYTLRARCPPSFEVGDLDVVFEKESIRCLYAEDEIHPAYRDDDFDIPVDDDTMGMAEFLH